MSSPRDAINALRLFQGSWEGENKIVVGIDIGTTQSGIAFAFLEKGERQQIHRVTSWPGQKVGHTTSKVPTLVWYDTDKRAVSFGAEALSPQAQEDAEDNGWRLAKHFILHLHPEIMRNQHGLNLDPLPNGISLLRVCSDFLGYLIRHTQSFFEDRVVNGRQLWQIYCSKIEFCIAHPNGWGIREQAFLRTAATNAGLVTNATAASCIRFVTEAEASVYFSIYHTNLGSLLWPGMNFAVCDAGGLTVNTTTYRVNSAHLPLELEEARVSACVQAGAIFVNAAAEQFVQRTLREAGLHEEDVEDYTKRGIQDFEKSLKRQFSGGTETKTIEVGLSRVNHPHIGIRRGQMRLEGAKVRQFFDICVNEITASVDQQLQGLDVSHILLVGGFGESPYLRSVFKDRYERRGCQITIPNDSSSKAVADGAIIWSTASNVSGRSPCSSFDIGTSVRSNSVDSDHQRREIITCPSGNENVSGIWSQTAAQDCPNERPQMSFGFETSVQFDYNLPEHCGRPVTSTPSGLKVIHGRWEEIVRECIPLEQNITHTKSVSLPFPSELSEFKLTLYSYSGGEAPSWMRDRSGRLLSGFRAWVTISVDLTKLSKAVKSRIGAYGINNQYLDFDICFQFGNMGVSANIQWKEKDEMKTAPATIISHYIL